MELFHYIFIFPLPSSRDKIEFLYSFLNMGWNLTSREDYIFSGCSYSEISYDELGFNRWSSPIEFALSASSVKFLLNLFLNNSCILLRWRAVKRWSLRIRRSMKFSRHFNWYRALLVQCLLEKKLNPHKMLRISPILFF